MNEARNKILTLLPYEGIFSLWQKAGADYQSARLLTISQVEAFEEIIKDNETWDYLISVFDSGRREDSWLALDWPEGFDELILCTPLCKLVDFNCRECVVGRSQNNNSCADDNSMFGKISVLIAENKRDELREHLDHIKTFLKADNAVNQ
jgi:hypothetical protein